MAKNVLPAAGKLWYQSYTIWYNVALAAIYALQGVAQVFVIPDPILELAGVTGNLLLRLRTKEPISM